ncbi:MAG: TlpA disulfide reductase family protein [Longimicrobiales bacterium]|nr:TlpA disulfide reductase family protein [Longimicrobiales bacterium]
MTLTGLTLLVALTACAPERPPAPGDRLPDAELEVVDPTATTWRPGDRISLSDLRGRPILLDFWASWCPPCREQHRHVTEVAERYEDRIAVLGILVDDTAENALRWMEAQGAAYPTVREVDGVLADAFWIPATGLPHLALLDADRRLIWHRLGASATGVPDVVLARLDSILRATQPIEAEPGPP